MEPRLVVKAVLLMVVVAVIAYGWWSRQKARTEPRERQTVAGAGAQDAEPSRSDPGRPDAAEARRRALVEEGSWPVEETTGPVAITFEQSKARVFPTSDDGEMVLPAGAVLLEWEVGFAHHDADDPEGIDVLSSSLRYRDGSGGVWTTNGAFGPVFASEYLFPEEEGTELRQARFVATAPESWRRALREKCLLAGARDLWDGRFYHPLRLDGERRTIHLAYQGPVLDLALLEGDDDHDRLLVRVSELYDENNDELPPFLFTMPLGEVVFRNTAGTEEGIEHVVELGEARPLVWRPPIR